MWAVMVMAAATGCAGQASPDVDVPSADQAWVASACQPVSIDTTGWHRHRIGDLTILVPPQYQAGAFTPYQLTFRGPGGSLRLYLHRNARYSFDASNAARRGQNWCNGILGGYQAEILAWHERFRGPNYNFVARLPATWGGQDEDKWLFVQIMASRLRDAYSLRDAVHTLASVRDTLEQRQH